LSSAVRSQIPDEPWPADQPLLVFSAVRSQLSPHFFLAPARQVLHKFGEKSSTFFDKNATTILHSDEGTMPNILLKRGRKLRGRCNRNIVQFVNSRMKKINSFFPKSQVLKTEKGLLIYGLCT
jgi:hypothetical protein